MYARADVIGVEKSRGLNPDHAQAHLVILDTCALVFDSLTPDRLSSPAREAIEQADAAGELACSDISLWEIAMLVERGRLNVSVEARGCIALLGNKRPRPRMTLA